MTEQTENPLDWLDSLANPPAKSVDDPGDSAYNIEDLPELLEVYRKTALLANSLKNSNESRKKEIIGLLADSDPTKENPYKSPNGKLIAYINVVERKSIKVEDAAILLKLTDYQKVLSVGHSVRLEVRETGE